MAGLLDGWVGGWNGWMDGWMGGWMDGRSMFERVGAATESGVVSILALTP